MSPDYTVLSHPGRAFYLIGLLLSVCAAVLFHDNPVVLADQLPVKVWTTMEGLPHNHINRIRRDSRGYLWICTDEGLARFDGHGFVNYSIAQGLPNHTINDLLETRNGDYWIATDGGVVLFNPIAAGQATPIFTDFRVGDQEVTNHVNSMIEDKDGSIWLATSGGLFRIRRFGVRIRIEPVEFGFPKGMSDERHVVNFFLDSRGALWIMAISGLYRRWPDGRTERYGEENGFPGAFVQSMFEDRRGRLWVGSRRHGLHLLVAEPQTVLSQPSLTQCGNPGTAG